MSDRLCFWSEGLRVASKIPLDHAGPSAATPPSTGFSRSRLSGSPRRERGSDAGWGQWEEGAFPGGLCEAGSEPDFVCPTGFALQIQCYQCEEFQLNNDCSSPEFIVNCTVNVQDMCQKEVMEQSAGKRLAAPLLLLPSPAWASVEVRGHCITGKDWLWYYAHIGLSRIYFYNAGKMESSKLL